MGRLDQQLGSFLERWLMRDVETGCCRFCNEALDEWIDEPAEQFCDDDCKHGFEAVQDARLALGERDLRQRGYD